MSKQVGVYHKDVGFPAGTAWPTGTFPLRYKTHAKDQAKDKQVGFLPTSLNMNNCQVVEAQVENGRKVNLMVVRRSLDMERDLVMVVVTERPVWEVITVYPNLRTDHHPTLNVSRYDKP